MSRRWSAIVVAAILLVVAVLIGRAYLTPDAGPKETASPAPGDSGGPSKGPKPRGKPAGGAASAGAAADGGAPAEAAVAFSAPWGGKLGELGRERPTEGNPEAPMSFAGGGDGRVLVLDQVNDRIVKYGPDGKPEGKFGSDLRTAQELAVGDDGTVAVMDRFGDKDVTIYDESGQVVGKLPLPGEGVEEPGELTGLFVDGKDIYAERKHGPLVKLGDTAGNPADPRSEIPGRPTRDGLSYINAGIIDAPAGRAYVSSIDRATNQHRFTRELRLEALILTIVLLDTDRAGIIYFGAHLEDAPNEEVIQVTCLDPKTGQPLGTAIMPANTMPEETFRDFAVLDGGGILYALRSESGVSYQRYDCR